MSWVGFIKDCSVGIYNNINWSILTLLVIIGASSGVMVGVIFLYLFAAFAHATTAVRTILRLT